MYLLFSNLFFKHIIIFSALISKIFLSIFVLNFFKDNKISELFDSLLFNIYSSIRKSQNFSNNFSLSSK